MSIYDENRTLRILRNMGPVSIDGFDGRLRLQKLAFLIQEMGTGGPFAYYWYIRGPYSPSLTQMLYSGDELGAYEDVPELTASERGTARKVQALLGSGIDDHSRLELYASVWYLAPDRPLSEEDIESIVDRMGRKSPTSARTTSRRRWPGLKCSAAIHSPARLFPPARLPRHGRPEPPPPVLHVRAGACRSGGGGAAAGRRMPRAAASGRRPPRFRPGPS